MIKKKNDNTPSQNDDSDTKAVAGVKRNVLAEQQEKSCGKLISLSYISAECLTTAMTEFSVLFNLQHAAKPVTDIPGTILPRPSLNRDVHAHHSDG